MNLHLNRVAAGVPTGGEFAGHERADAAVELDAPIPITVRLERENPRGYIEEVSTTTFDARPLLNTLPVSAFSEDASDHGDGIFYLAARAGLVEDWGGPFTVDLTTEELTAYTAARVAAGQHEPISSVLPHGWEQAQREIGLAYAAAYRAVRVVDALGPLLGGSEELARARLTDAARAIRVAREDPRIGSERFTAADDDLLRDIEHVAQGGTSDRPFAVTVVMLSGRLAEAALERR